MQSGGGFIIDDLSTVFEFDATGGRPDPKHKDTEEDHIPESVATPEPLSSKQEAKLRSFLDGALEDITRGYRKRFDPSSLLHTLPSYLAEWMRLLGVLAHVPPYGSGSTNLLVSYLLRCSTDLCDGITGYSLAMEAEAFKRQRKRQREEQPAGTSGDQLASDEDGDSDSDEEEERQRQIASRTRQLNLALQTLDLLDRIWAAVLRGNLINLPVALSNAKAAFPESTEPAGMGEESSSGDESKSGKSRLPRAVYSTSSLVPSPAIDGRFASRATASSSTAPRESLPIHGGRGNRTVGVTDQIRLRNIAISSRDKLFSWMRSELDAPAPPTMEENDLDQEEPRGNTVEGTLEIKQDPATVLDTAEEGDDPDFEDVAIGEEQPDEEEGYDAGEDTEEHQHYQDLFDRKIDPDADDDDEDEDQPTAVQRTREEDDSDQRLGASVAGTVEAVTSPDAHIKRKRELDSEGSVPIEEPRADGLPSKRPRAPSTDRDTDAGGADGNVKMSRSEMGSINFSLSDAIGQWDISFTRLFSKTLRTLSDLSDFTKRGGKTDFASSLAGISGADEQEPADERH
ncbi:hypothetical protein PSEUBRA_000283 [Kalmanozyma brasiliensis GHG001]|uniref:Uncharacterized protein n=1 Tax=Kalmanozyma brasiliensis (strain GHG001) TaxID=1365824 RepID=V5GVG1_KALBG|nr:uncharacterized protein PSEUBRA_000283 [Kalmanozyma brasiliensis GHG001]EST09887.1 hypothetical protein PSEUBRA_000283 [Kalmanozyma brasiliensis GHG001]